jgi:NAD(P)-dependent dehydrogenase (short-subunit alcohol dehydrogenase family)
MILRGASCLVTGAGRGIGRAVALALAREGARVTGVSRTGGELASLADEARGSGGELLACPGDVRDAAFCAEAVRRAGEVHGRLQVLVNNAGVGHTAALAETSDAVWDETIGTNLTAVFRLTRAALPQLTRGGGHVFMVSSLAGSNAIAGMSAYCASKAALDHLSRCLMLEVRQAGVKVTVLAPGSVDTGFGRHAAASEPWKLRPEDVAGAILDLLRTRDEAHLSRVELRPLKPPGRA